LRTDGPTFVVYLIAFIVIVAVLTFLTALVLGPLAQALGTHLIR
jgi:K+-transporting ATPase A subunit